MERRKPPRKCKAISSDEADREVAGEVVLEVKVRGFLVSKDERLRALDEEAEEEEEGNE